MIIPNRYKLAGNSINGGMGEIHACMDNHLNRRVVFKILKSGEEERRLLDEQKALLQIRSKHVVQLFDIAEVTIEKIKKQALVLEYIDGETLKIGGFKPDTEFMKLLWQISCGLSEIHQARIIHRDIKPSNIKIDTSGIVKILDFGLSRNSGEDAHTISAIGTPVFMAPELWSKSAVSFDQSIDVYAFAITALALLKGGKIPAELTELPPKPLKPDSLNNIFSGLPIEVIKAIESCLSYKSSGRPSISLVEKLLRRHLLQDKHRALLVADEKIYELHAGSRIANISIAPLGSISINYNGINFLITSFSGSISINNKNAILGSELPECCVITFGSGSSRKFITFDVSNPEVIP